MSRLVPIDADLDKEQLLDVSVNLIPIAILLFFVVLFAVYTPWPPNLFMYLMSHFLTIFPLLLLALLTYVSAKAIARDEEGMEESSAGAATPEERPEAETEFGTGSEEGPGEEQTGEEQTGEEQTSESR
ncbi:DUF6684 family protein [Halomarina pelagica]|uniref:DUF6684 family protein n=1 Tax=Halomarina pelagica TaxID=2961599 RepID=UPI0020C20448|nr:DUF6684 family protein [Halomarina sp. BND7]